MDRECIFRVSGGMNLEKLSAWYQLWWCFCGFNVCAGLPKKTLNMSLTDETFKLG